MASSAEVVLDLGDASLAKKRKTEAEEEKKEKVWNNFDSRQ